MKLSIVLDTQKKVEKGKQPSVACHEQTNLDAFLTKEEKCVSTTQNVQTDNFDSDAPNNEEIQKQGSSVFYL